MSGAPLLHRQQGAAAICGWDIVFVNILLAGFIVPRQLYSSDVSWLQPSHQPPILSTIPWCSNHIARRCGGNKVRNGLQYYLQMLANSPANFLLPASLLLQSMQQYTTHNNQTPRNNQSLDQLLKDQQRKKVSNGLLASCWLSIIIISYSPLTSCFKQAYHHTTPKFHTTISHLLNRKLLDEVEEVSLLAQSNNIKYKLVTSVLMSLIEAPFWMVRHIHYIANHCKNNSWHLLSPLWLFVVSIFGYLGSCIESSAVHSMKWWC